MNGDKVQITSEDLKNIPTKWTYLKYLSSVAKTKYEVACAILRNWFNHIVFGDELDEEEMEILYELFRS